MNGNRKSYYKQPKQTSHLSSKSVNYPSIYHQFCFFQFPYQEDSVTVLKKQKTTRNPKQPRRGKGSERAVRTKPKVSGL
jgi:hypothetical protein